ncbi:SMP-30/gluconolactonase/LRE family protein [bacterium]|nr:SMP-30/gluconolactonase/LRE family protein [bacterium]
MRTRSRRWPKIVGGLVLLLAAFVGKTLWDAGAFRRISPHFAGRCREIHGVVGPEDVVVHPRTRIAYAAGYDRRAAERGEPSPGAIWSWPLDRPNTAPRNLTPAAGIDFQPHGLGLWLAPEGGRDRLFVVNHPAPGSGKPKHSVDVFEIDGETLTPVASWSDPDLLVMPNDVVPVGPDRFYLTNTHANPKGFAQNLETYLQLPRAKVLYFDGGRFRAVREGELFPNGVAASADGKRIWVASTTGREVKEYERDPSSGALRFARSFFVGTGVDNIDVDAAGDLWIGSHPNLLAVPPMLTDPSAKSPSQVVRLRPSTGEVEEVFLDDGSRISGSSVGVHVGDRLIVGQIFGDFLLDCTMER